MKSFPRIILLLLCLSLGVHAVGQTITGIVVDQTNNAIPGANVIVKGTVIGAITDLNGNYFISAKEGDVLSFSFVGYEKQDAVIGTDNTINIQLIPSKEVLDEVVVVGYGTQDRSAITAAISSADGEELQKMATSNLISSLQGRVSGVQVSQSGINPGDSPNIMIRGISTFNGNNPLYVVDGAPVEDITFLTPSDIADVQVLKDASAAAIYGSRGSNGVILVSTVKGKREGLSITAEAKTGFQSFERDPLIADATEFEYAMAQYNDLDEPNPVTVNSNWFDEVRSDPALIQNYSLGINGAENKVRYNFSGNYFSQDGIIKGKNYEQLNARMGLSMDLSEKISIDHSFIFTHSTQRPGAGSEPWDAMRLLPTDEVYLPVDQRAGKNEYSIYAATSADVSNLVARIARNDQEYKTLKTFSNTSLNYKILEGLTFKSQYSFYYSLWQNNSFSPKYFINTSDNNEHTSVNREHNMKFNYSWSNTLTYKRKIDEHKFSVMAGNSLERDRHETLQGSKTNVPHNTTELRFLDGAIDGERTSGANEINSLVSFFGRVTYSYGERYFATTNFRADASSRFSKNNQWGFFPSFSVGWNIANEAFMANVEWLNSLKIRGGWGQIGNQNIDKNAKLTVMRSQNRDYITGPNGDRMPGAEPQLGNPDLIWETVTDLNIGVDMKVLNGLSVTFDVFDRLTSDMLLPKTAPHHLGIPSSYIGGTDGTIWSNIGGIRTKGWDATVSYNMRKNNWTFSASTNLTRSKAIVENMADPGQIINGIWDRLGYITRTEEGGGVSQFYGFEMLGIFQNETEINNHSDNSGKLIQPGAKPGDVIYADLTGDGKINEEDVKYIGDPTPDLYYGLTFTAGYKAFDFTTTLQGTLGNDIVNGMGWYTYNGNRGNSNLQKGAGYRAWNGENSTNEYPRLSKASELANFQRFSSLYIENGSFLRIQNIQIGYTLNNVMDISSIRLYVTAQNLFTFSSYKGMDTDLSGGSWGLFDRGIDWGDYPTPRTIMAGVRLAF
jgi:TonB-linked SusC/RagA family outer membrane protein